MFGKSEIEVDDVDVDLDIEIDRYGDRYIDR